MKTVTTCRADRLALLTFMSAAAPLALAAAPDCLETTEALEYWRPVVEQAENADLPADSLARELVGCLASPAPELRDGTAYELYTLWLRNDRLTDDTRRLLLTELSSRLADPSPAATLPRSFSALVLAELMRSDAIEPFMDDVSRETLLATVGEALREESDYRGLDPALGWVHPVAHMADLLWRFALHPATTSDEARAVLDAVRAKAAPNTTAYAFNEPDRLARAVSTVILRELVPAEDTVAWLETYATPTSLEKWSDAFRTPSGMAELHNTKLFLRALSDQLDGEDVDAGIATLLDQLVQGFTGLI